MDLRIVTVFEESDVGVPFGFRHMLLPVFQGGFEESDVGVPFGFRHMLLPVFEGGFEDCNCF